jgi:hypothetical protein
MAAIVALGLLKAFSSLFPVVVMAPNGSQTRCPILGFGVVLITMAIRSETQSNSKKSAIRM